MSFNEDDNYDNCSRSSSNSGDSGYFGCDSFKGDSFKEERVKEERVSDEDAEIVDMSEEGEPLVLKEDTLFAWWDRVTDTSLPFWAAMKEDEPEEDAPKKERLAYIFNALELGIHGFTKFTRALCSAIEDRDQQLLELELENRTLVMRNSTLTIERDLLTKERDALDKEATHFVMRNSTITYERDEAIRERDGLKKEVDKLKGLNELLYNDAARERKALEERNESLYYDAARERDALEKEVEKLKEKNQSLHYGAGLERGILKTQLEQLKEEKKMLLRQNSNIETEVKKQNCQVTITKKERDDLRVAVDNMRCDAPYQVLARWMESPGYGF